MGIVRKITHGFSLREILDNRIFKHSIVYVVAIIIEKAIPFLLLPVMVTYLSTIDYGILQNYIGLQQLLMAFVGFNAMGAIGVSYYKKNREENAEYISSFLFLGLLSIFIVFLILILFNDLIGHYYDIPLKWQLLSIVHCLFAFIFLLYINILRLEKKPVPFGVMNILKTLVELLISLYLIIIIGKKWEGRVIGMVLSIAFFAGVCVVLLFRKGYIRWVFRKELLKDLLFFGLPLIPMGISAMLKGFLNKGFITHFEGISENGLFGLAMNFGMLMYVITFAFSSTFNPTLYEKLSNPQKHTKKRLVRIIYIYFVGLLMLVFVLQFFSKFFIIRFIKPEWSGTVPYIFWILLAYALSGVQLIVSQFIYFVKKTKYMAPISIFNNLFHILISYYAIRWLGTIGIVYALSFSAFTSLCTTWYFSNKFYPMPWFKSQN